MRSLLGFPPFNNFMLLAQKPFLILRYHRGFCCSYSIPSPRSDRSALNALLTLTPASKSWFSGSQLHGHVIKLGLSNDTFSQNNLITIYSKRGLFGYGLKVFDEMLEKNIVSWTVVISGAIQNDQFELGFKLYMQMMQTEFRPNEFALSSITKACTEVNAADMGLCIHCLALKIGLDQSQFVGSSILHMYAKSGDIESAEQVFVSVENLDTGCWNAMIGGYAECGCGFEAVRIVSLMQCKGIRMDNYTFINALKACFVIGEFNLGREIHGLMLKSSFELDSSMMNSLMDLYFKIDKRGTALNVFHTMHTDVVSWNILFSNFCLYEDSRDVANMFCKMLSTNMKPNHTTFSIMFRLCGEAHDLDLGLQFYCLALHLGFSHEHNVVSLIITMFSKCGEMEMAHLVFDSICLNTVITWNKMILGYNLNCSYADALQIFRKLWELGVNMDEHTFSNALEGCSNSENHLVARQIHGIVIKIGFSDNDFVCSSLIKVYVRSGLVDDSYQFFSEPEKLDSASWGTMVSELVHQGSSNEIFKLLNYLTETGGKPDEFFLSSILSGCANLSVYHQTRSVHSLVTKLGFEMHFCVASAVIDAYGKCGDIETARTVFEHYSSRSGDVVVFNSMIMAYAHHGLMIEAMKIFDKMMSANLQPSQATFVSVLSACNHYGQVERGRTIFKLISSFYGVKPSSDIYGCLVDMFSRNGLLEDAKQVIQEMPFRPWPAIWTSLLNGCRIYGNQELGEWAANKLLQLAPKNEAAYVLLSKVYSEGGSWQNAAELGRKMIERAVQKDQGCSWIEP